MIPAQITAGDTLRFTDKHSEYMPADGWVLRYVLVSATTKIEINATDNGDGQHLFDVAMADTAGWDDGAYQWQRYAMKGTAERHSIGSGSVVILPDFSTAIGGVDARLSWQVVLDNLMAAYTKLTKTTATVVQVSVNGRSTSFRDGADLLVQIDNARKMAAREKREQAAMDAGNAAGAAHKIYFRA